MSTFASSCIHVLLTGIGSLKASFAIALRLFRVFSGYLREFQGFLIVFRSFQSGAGD